MTMYRICLLANLLLLACAAPYLRCQELVTKAYDLRALVAAEAPWVAGELRTPKAGSSDQVFGREARAFGAIDSDMLQFVLECAFGPSENGSAQPLLDLQNGILLATADEKAQERLQAWIDLCYYVFMEQVTLELHVLPTSVLNGSSSVLRREEVDSLLRTSLPHPCFRVTGRVGAELFLGSLGSMDIVRDYDVEVAQKAAISDPKIDKLLTGIAWGLRARRCVDGRLLLQVEGQEAASPSAPRQLDVQHRDLRGKRQAVAIQLPALEYASINAVARVRDGEAMLLGGGTGQGSAYCIRLHRVTPAAEQGKGSWIWLPVADLGLSGTMQWSANLLPIRPGDESPWSSRNEALKLHQETTLTQVLTHLRRIHAAAEVVTFPMGELLLHADSANQGIIKKVVTDLAAITQQDLTLEVRSGRLAASDAFLLATSRTDANEVAGRLPTTTLLPTLVDTPFHHVLVMEHSYLSDFDVEIASDSSVPNPIVRTAVTGLAIAGRVLASGPNRFRLLLEASTSDLMAPIETFDLKDEELSAVELTKIRTIPFEISAVVEAKRWHLVHMAPLIGCDEHFVMVARVKN